MLCQTPVIVWGLIPFVCMWSSLAVVCQNANTDGITHLGYMLPQHFSPKQTIIWRTKYSGHHELRYRRVLLQNIANVRPFWTWLVVFNIETDKSFIHLNLSRRNWSFVEINPKLMSYWCVMLPFLFPESPSPSHNISSLEYGFSLCQEINHIRTAGKTWAIRSSSVIPVLTYVANWSQPGETN